MIGLWLKRKSLGLASALSGNDAEKHVSVHARPGEPGIGEDDAQHSYLQKLFPGASDIDSLPRCAHLKVKEVFMSTGALYDGAVQLIQVLFVAPQMQMLVLPLCDIGGDGAARSATAPNGAGGARVAETQWGGAGTRSTTPRRSRRW